MSDQEGPEVSKPRKFDTISDLVKGAKEEGTGIFKSAPGDDSWSGPLYTALVYANAARLYRDEFKKRAPFFWKLSFASGYYARTALVFVAGVAVHRFCLGWANWIELGGF